MKRATYAIPSLALTSLAAACGGDPIINEFNVNTIDDTALPYTYDNGAGLVINAVSSTMVVNDDLSASFTVTVSVDYNGQAYDYTYTYAGTFTAVEVGAAYTIAINDIDGGVINLDCAMDADVNLNCTDDDGGAWNFAPL